MQPVTIRVSVPTVYQVGEILPPGFQVPAVTTVSVPNTAKDLTLQIRINEGKQSFEQHYPVDSLPNTQQVVPTQYPTERLLKIGDVTKQGPLSWSVTNTQSYRNCDSSQWEIYSTVNVSNGYGYNLSLRDESYLYNQLGQAITLFYSDYVDCPPGTSKTWTEEFTYDIDKQQECDTVQLPGAPLILAMLLPPVKDSTGTVVVDYAFAAYGLGTPALAPRPSTH